MFGIQRLVFSVSIRLKQSHRPTVFTTLVRLLRGEYLVQTSTDTDAKDEGGITEIDYEEQTAGYQAAYSRLAASEAAEEDPVAYVRDPQEFLGQQLMEMSKAYGPQQVKAVISAADQSIVGPFMQTLGFGL